MARKFNENETFKLVELYREQECLWNIRCDVYKNREIRISALQQIQKGMGMEGLTIQEIKNKIKSIRSTYYLEVDKIDKSTRSGAGGNGYVPKVKWFEELNSFIKNVAVRRRTTDNTENSNTDSEFFENEFRMVSPRADNGSQVAPPTTPRSENKSTAEESILTPSLKRSKRSKMSQMATMVNDLRNINENMAGTEESERTQNQQLSYQLALYCPPPEISPSGTTSSYTSYHSKNSEFSPPSYHSLDQSKQASNSDGGIIALAFKDIN